MLLKLTFIISIFLLSNCFAEKRNVVDFSIKPLGNTNGNIPITLLSEKWETIVKLSPGKNGNRTRGRVSTGLGNKNVILRLDNDDITQKYSIISLTNNSNDHLVLETKQYKLKLSTSVQDFVKLIQQKQNPSDCNCVHKNCACCLVIDIKDFQHSVCVNATYNPVTIGLDLSIGFDGHYFSEEISVRNPPPICFSLPIPAAEHILGACVAFSDLDLNKKDNILSGCVQFEVEVVHLQILHFKLGCFRMPI